MAEGIAAFYLRLKGYHLLGRRVRTPFGEVDLIARRGQVVVFCEVKFRKTIDKGRYAINPVSLRRVRSAAFFLLSLYTDGSEDARIDAIIIAPWRWPLHLKAISVEI